MTRSKPRKHSEVAGALVARAATVTDSAQTQQIASLVDLVHLLVSRVPGAPMQMPHPVPHAAHSAPRAAPAAKAAQPARPAAAGAPVASAAGAPAAERPAAAGAARAASARGPSRRGGLPARVGETSLCRNHVQSIPVAAATRLIASCGSEGQMARDGIVRGALRDASYLGSTRHVRRLFSDCYGPEETAVAAAAVRVAAAAADGVSLPVCLAVNLVRFVHDVSGRDRPAGGGVVSASFLNAKPAVGGIGVEPRRGGVLRVLFTVASDAVADTVVRSRRNLRDVDPSAAVFDVLSDREEAQHRALWPAFLAAKAAGKRAQFHRARLVVDGERANRAAKRSWRAAEELAASRQAAAVASARRQAQAHTQSAVPQAVAAAALPQLSRQEIEQARAERKTAKRAARAAGEDFVEAGPRPAAPQAAAAAPPQGAQLSRQEVEQARVERKTAKRAARAVGEDFAGRAPAPAAPAAAVVGGGGRVSDWSQPAPHHGASGQGARGGAPWEQQQQQQAGGDYGGGDGGGGALTEEERFAAKAARRREQKGAKRQRLLASQIGRVPPPWAPGAPASLPKHTFEVGDPRDHAETPFEAYRDLEPLLFRLAGLQGRTKATLRVYDPYFCAGSVKRHLSQLGFTDVYNENVDFYAQQASSGVPEFDVLITNPPFSGDHMARALAFAAACGKPWALLVPDFVARKAYFAPTLQIQESGEGPAMSKPCGPIYYLGPRTNAYMFSTPNPAEEGSCGGGGGGVRVFTAAAFQCVWILGLGAQHANAMAVWWSSRYGRVSDCELADSADALPQLASDRGKKRRDEAAAKRAASAACSLHMRPGLAAADSDSDSETSRPADTRHVASAARRLDRLVHPATPFAVALAADVRRVCAAVLAAAGDHHTQQQQQPGVAPVAAHLHRLGYRLRVASARVAAPFRVHRHEFLIVTGRASSGADGEPPVGHGHGGSSAAAIDEADQPYAVDVHFREKWVITKPSATYARVLDAVSDALVAPCASLPHLVKLLSAEAAASFEARELALPPWRMEASMMSNWAPATEKAAGGAGADKAAASASGSGAAPRASDRGDDPVRANTRTNTKFGFAL
ncbi:hypothetical protein FOA52_002069 [Chlamydomonas sp. UWO 241]|nr:hypothetical protein FOA52_002069 [Chlamydomonas sp. UWO 241]